MSPLTATVQLDTSLAHAGFAHCRRCGQVRDIEAFARSRNRKANGRQYMCRPCAYARARELGIKKRGADGDKAYRSRISNEHQKRQRAAEPERCAARDRDRRLKRRYGIDSTDFDRLLAEQDGRCAICMVPHSDKWVVDHNHDTGKVRGILCNLCNVGLGHFSDSPESLQAALIYLRPRRDLSSQSGFPLSSPDWEGLLQESEI
jgi:hypothetical protein